MKKQDNESLIQELTKRLDWYIMEASDEEFDADEVQTLMKLLDNLKTEEDNVDKSEPVAEKEEDKPREGKLHKVLWYFRRRRFAVVAAAVLVVMVLGGSWQVVANAEKHGGFFWWMDKNEEGTTMITAPEGGKVDPNNYTIERYYSMEKIPEEYREYVEEIGEIKGNLAYTLGYVKVTKNEFNDTLYVYMNNVGDKLRFEIRIYPEDIQRVRETYPGYTFEREFEDEGISFDVFSKEESSGEYTYIMYFYYGKEKYIVIGRNDEDRIQDIVIAYKNVVLSHEGNQQ